MPRVSGVLVLLVLVFGVGVAAVFAGVHPGVWAFELRARNAAVTQLAAVPEPTTLLLFGVALAAAAAGGRRMGR
jgi:hypothetical protein